MKFISRAKRKALEEKLAALEQDSTEAKALRAQLGWGESEAPRPAPAPKAAPAPKTAPAPEPAPAAKKPSTKAKVVAAAKKAFSPKKKSNKN